MRSLILVFVFLTKLTWGVCAPNTVSFWLVPGYPDVTDPCGGYTATKVGTPASGSFCASSPSYGPFTGNTSRYDAPASFRTAWEAAGAANTVESYVYLTSTAVQQVPYRWTDTAAVWELNITATTPASAEWRRFAGGFSGVATGAVLSVGVCYHIATTLSGNIMAIYLDNVLKQSAAVTAMSGTVTEWSFGGEDGGAALLSGLISGFRTSNIARTSFPTIDPSGDSDCLFGEAECED